MLVCLVAACGLAWWWLLRTEQDAMPMPMPMPMPMGGMDMEAGMMMTASPPVGGAAAVATFLMWFVMMVAMMLPSAAPMILLYQRFAETSRKAGGMLLPTGLFVLVYLAVWAGFSFVATMAQIALTGAGFVDAASLAFGDRRIAGALLIVAALYQLTPAKLACLKNCTSPLTFLRREWGPGWSNAVRLGFKHGLFCVGCCWLMMALLFVGGVMNLAWVAALAVIVLIEKIAPAPNITRMLIAAVACLGGLYLLLR